MTGPPRAFLAPAVCLCLAAFATAHPPPARRPTRHESAASAGRAHLARLSRGSRAARAQLARRTRRPRAGQLAQVHVSSARDAPCATCCPPRQALLGRQDSQAAKPTSRRLNDEVAPTSRVPPIYQPSHLVYLVSEAACKSLCAERAEAWTGAPARAAAAICGGWRRRRQSVKCRLGARGWAGRRGGGGVGVACQVSLAWAVPRGAWGKERGRLESGRAPGTGGARGSAPARLARTVRCARATTGRLDVEAAAERRQGSSLEPARGGRASAAKRLVTRARGRTAVGGPRRAGGSCCDLDW